MNVPDNLQLHESQSYRVLIVEDMEDLSTTLAWLLEGEGYTVRTLGHLHPTAVEQALAFRPNVALVDISLPDGSGLSLVPQLVAQGTMVICMSGWATRQQRDNAAAAGCAEFLLKPVPFDDVLKTVRRYCTPRA